MSSSHAAATTSASRIASTLHTVLTTRSDGQVRACPHESGESARPDAAGSPKAPPRLEARPTTHVALQCYRGRELDVVTQVETIDANRALREHYGCLTHAVSMLEAVDQVAQERERNVALYRMLVGCAVHAGDRPVADGERGLLLEAALARGLPPDARCARCGDDGPFTAFDLDEGGVLCAGAGVTRGGAEPGRAPRCRRADGRGRPSTVCSQLRRPASCSPRWNVSASPRSSTTRSAGSAAPPSLAPRPNES